MTKHYPDKEDDVNLTVVVANAADAADATNVVNFFILVN